MDRAVGRDGDRVGGHGVADRQFGPEVVDFEKAEGRDGGGRGLAQVAETDDADQVAAFVDDGEAAAAILGHEVAGVGERVLAVAGVGVGGHPVLDLAAIRRHGRLRGSGRGRAAGMPLGNGRLRSAARPAGRGWRDRRRRSVRSAHLRLRFGLSVACAGG